MSWFGKGPILWPGRAVWPCPLAGSLHVFRMANVAAGQQCQAGLVSSLTLDTSRGGESTSSPGELCQRLPILIFRKDLEGTSAEVTGFVETRTFSTGTPPLSQQRFVLDVALALRLLHFSCCLSPAAFACSDVMLEPAHVPRHLQPQLGDTCGDSGG